MKHEPLLATRHEGSTLAKRCSEGGFTVGQTLRNKVRLQPRMLLRRPENELARDDSGGLWTNRRIRIMGVLASGSRGRLCSSLRIRLPGVLVFG